MRTVVRALFLLSLILAPQPLQAQEEDAFVLPPGTLRLRGVSEISAFDAVFGADGERVPLAGHLSQPLSSRTFAPLVPLEDRLGGFLSATGSSLVGDPQSVQLGSLDLAARARTQVIPLSLSVGVLPGLELEVGAAFLREEVLPTRYELAGGTLGVNPDPEGNAEILTLFGEEWSAMGESPFLPTDSSALGLELQRIVAERFPEHSLELPEAGADTTVLDALLVEEFGLAPLDAGATGWRSGDIEVAARYRLLSTFGAKPVPTDSMGLHYRIAVSASARFPTGAEPDSVRLLSYLPGVGQSGFGLGFDGDLFAGERIWATASLRYEGRSEVEVLRRVAPPEAPLSVLAPPRAVRWSPADRVSFRLVPRYRLTEAISLAGRYSLLRLGDSTIEAAGGESGDASVLNTEGGFAQRAGLGIRYSTLPAYWEGAGLLPVEIVLAYETTLNAPTRRPDASTVILQFSLLHPLIGGRP